jgi:hypothetical protein
MVFLQTQLFATPKWLLDNTILNKISNPVANERIQSIQASTLRSLLDKNRLYKLITISTRFPSASYSLNEMMEDTRKGLFSELTSRQASDIFRRNLQKLYVGQMGELIIPAASAGAPSLMSAFMAPSAEIKNTDVVSEAKAQLKKLAATIQANKASISDAATVNHLSDLQDRIKEILDPK